MSFYLVIYIHPVTSLFAILLNTWEVISSIKKCIIRFVFSRSEMAVEGGGFKLFAILLVYLGISFFKFKPLDEKKSTLNPGA